MRRPSAWGNFECDEQILLLCGALPWLRQLPLRCLQGFFIGFRQIPYTTKQAIALELQSGLHPEPTSTSLKGARRISGYASVSLLPWSHLGRGSFLVPLAVSGAFPLALSSQVWLPMFPGQAVVSRELAWSADLRVAPSTRDTVALPWELRKPSVIIGSPSLSPCANFHPSFAARF
jgi:hypothetical protein